MKRKKNFVCITGIDGSGKTTICKMLINRMDRNGFSFSYVYCGWRQFSSFIFLPFIIIFKKLNSFTKKSYLISKNKQEKSINNYMKNKFSTLFQNLVLIDYLLNIFFKIKMPLLLGKNIICDRYVFDVVIGLGIDLGYNNDKILKLLRILLYVVPKPDIIFLIDVPEEVSFSRKDDVPSPEYLSKPRSLYLNLPVEHQMIMIDGTRDINDIINIVYNNLSI